MSTCFLMVFVHFWNSAIGNPLTAQGNSCGTLFANTVNEGMIVLTHDPYTLDMSDTIKKA